MLCECSVLIIQNECLMPKRVGKKGSRRRKKKKERGEDVMEQYSHRGRRRRCDTPDNNHESTAISTQLPEIPSLQKPPSILSPLNTYLSAYRYRISSIKKWGEGAFRRHGFEKTGLWVPELELFSLCRNPVLVRFEEIYVALHVNWKDMLL